jgi:peptidoglycan hydrolase CwlO-like protein
MANEMTTARTHLEALKIFDLAVEQLDLDKSDLRPSQVNEAVGQIEERLDAIVNEWDTARDEVKKEMSDIEDNLSDAQSRIEALEGDLETMREERDEARGRCLKAEEEAQELYRDLAARRD